MSAAANVIAMPLRRGRAPSDGFRVMGMFPRGSAGRMAGRIRPCWVYAIGLRDGTIKFGRSIRPRWRLADHWNHNDGLLWVHLFSRFDSEGDAGRAERAICSRSERIARRIRQTERFADFEGREAAIALAREAIADVKACLAAERLVAEPAAEGAT